MSKNKRLDEIEKYYLDCLESDYGKKSKAVDDVLWLCDQLKSKIEYDASRELAIEGMREALEMSLINKHNYENNCPCMTCQALAAFERSNK